MDSDGGGLLDTMPSERERERESLSEGGGLSVLFGVLEPQPRAHKQNQRQKLNQWHKRGKNAPKEGVS